MATLQHDSYSNGQPTQEYDIEKKTSHLGGEIEEGVVVDASTDDPQSVFSERLAIEYRMLIAL